MCEHPDSSNVGIHDEGNFEFDEESETTDDNELDESGASSNNNVHNPLHNDKD